MNTANVEPIFQRVVVIVSEILMVLEPHQLGCLI